MLAYKEKKPPRRGLSTFLSRFSEAGWGIFSSGAYVAPAQGDGVVFDLDLDEVIAGGDVVGEEPGVVRGV